MTGVAGLMLGVLLIQSGAPALPWTTLHAVQAQATERRHMQCGPTEAMLAVVLFIPTTPTEGYYIFVANGRFAVARVDRTPEGNSATYVWLGAVRDQGVLDVTMQDVFSPERFGRGPCPWLMKGTIQREPTPNGFCGAPRRTHLSVDLCT